MVVVRVLVGGVVGDVVVVVGRVVGGRRRRRRVSGRVVEVGEWWSGW